MIEQMHEILMNLNRGRIAVSEAQEQILDLFSVMQQSELLLSFIQWWIGNNKRRDVKHTLEEIVNEFIKTKQ